jgi:2-phosphoglycerate kinase
MNKLYVFYGIACVGKSTMALHFAYKHAIRTIIHSDYIREVQRAYTQLPALMKVTHNAWELFGKQSSENIVRGFIAHVDAVAPALMAIAHKLAKDGFDAIVEGVHCYSHVLDQLAAIDDLVVLPRLLVVSSESVLLDHVQRKEEERSGEAKDWKDHTPTLMRIQGFLIEDANRHHIPIICID